MIKIKLDGKRETMIREVFIYGKGGKVRRKLWIYGNGTITYREWSDTGTQLYGQGEKILLPSLIEKKKGKKESVKKRRKKRQPKKKQSK